MRKMLNNLKYTVSKVLWELFMDSDSVTLFKSQFEQKIMITQELSPISALPSYQVLGEIMGK